MGAALCRRPAGGERDGRGAVLESCGRRKRVGAVLESCGRRKRAGAVLESCGRRKRVGAVLEAALPKNGRCAGGLQEEKNLARRAGRLEPK